MTQANEESRACFEAFMAWWNMAERPNRDQMSALEGFVAAWPTRDRTALAFGVLPLIREAGIRARIGISDNQE